MIRRLQGMRACLALVAIASILSFGGFSSNDWQVHVKPIDRIKLPGDEGTFALHSFVEVQQPPESTTSMSRRSGFSVSFSLADPQIDVTLLWTRPYVSIHVPAEWQPIDQELGTLWWDDRTNTLWLAMAVTTKLQSMIHVDQLTLARDDGADTFAVTGFSQFKQQLNHMREEQDRISRLILRSHDDGGVILDVGHRDETTTSLEVPLAEAPIPAAQARERLFSTTQQVEGLLDAIREAET